MRWRRALAGVGVAVAVTAAVALSGVLVAGVAAWPMRTAGAAAERGVEALRDGEWDAASSELARARRSFRVARVVLWSQPAWVSRPVPLVGQNVAALRDMAVAGDLTSTAAVEVLKALSQLPGGVEAFVPEDGALPLEPWGALAPALDAAAGRLEAAQATLDASPELLVVQPVARRRALLAERVRAGASAARAAAAVSEHLPALLGAERPRRYFFGAGNPAELRGSGGFIGAFTILEVNRGRLRFGRFEELADLPSLPYDEVEPPHADFAARYDRFGGAGFWHNINMTPDFPSAATAIENLYERVRRERLDGTIVADPFALEALLRVSGPREIEGVGVTVDHRNVVEYVTHRAYEDIPRNEERKHVLGAVAAAALTGVLEGEAPTDALSVWRALAEAVGSGHLLVHAADPALQEALELTGLAGALPSHDTDVAALVLNNAASNKVDYYLEQTLRYEAELLDDGTVRARVDVALANHAPRAGVSDYVIGPNVRGLGPGDHRLAASVYCPAACRLWSFEVDGRPQAVVAERELGLAVFSAGVDIGSGEGVTLSYEVETPGAWARHPTGAAGRYRLLLRPQVTVRPVDVDITVQVPPGMRVVHAGGAEVDGRTVRYTGTPGGDVVVEIELARPPLDQLGAAVRDLLGREVFRLGVFGDRPQ